MSEVAKEPYRPTAPSEPGPPSVHEHVTQPHLSPEAGLGGTSWLDPASASRAPTGSVSLPSVPGYRVVEEIGRGSMGIVYRAWHERLDLEVALKIPTPIC